MSINNAIERAFDKKKKMEKKDEHGNWKYPMYWAIDLHDCIIPGTYSRNNEGREFYPCAKEVLQWLTNRTDMCVILWTSSHKDSIEDIVKWLGESGIKFDYINENPECKVSNLCDFSSKFYFDVLLDDKAGFNGKTDWAEIKSALMNVFQWNKKVSHDKD